MPPSGAGRSGRTNPNPVLPRTPSAIRVRSNTRREITMRDFSKAPIMGSLLLLAPLIACKQEYPTEWTPDPLFYLYDDCPHPNFVECT